MSSLRTADEGAQATYAAQPLATALDRDKPYPRGSGNAGNMAHAPQ